MNITTLMANVPINNPQTFKPFQGCMRGSILKYTDTGVVTNIINDTNGLLLCVDWDEKGPNHVYTEAEFAALSADWQRFSIEL